MFMSQGLRYTLTVTSFKGRDGVLLAKKSVLVKSLAQRENVRENDSLWVRSQGGGGGGGGRPVTLSIRRFRNVRENPPGLSTGLYDFFFSKHL